MSRCRSSRPLLRRATVATGVVAGLAALVSAGCDRGTPATAVRDLSWVCGLQRCTATFRLVNQGDDDERLKITVRADAGESVAQRKTLGEHRERVELRAKQARRFSVTVQTAGPASRLRVVVAYAGN